MNDSEPLAAFAQALENVRRQAGHPSLERLEQLTAQQGHRLARSTIHQKLAGRTVPNWAFVEAFVRACATHARQCRSALPAEDGDLERWHRDLNELHRQLDAARPRRRHTAAVQREPEDDHATERAFYLQRLLDRYRRLDLEILTPKEQDEHRKLMLRSVFVPQMLRADLEPVELSKELRRRLVESGELGVEDLPGLDPERLARAREVFAQQPTRPVLDVLMDRTQRLVVLLGDPGAGKSTLARYVAVALAEPGNTALAALGEHLPVLIELRSYAEVGADVGFLEYVHRCRDTDGLGISMEALSHYLDGDGRVIVIFDGLDELFDPAVRDRVSNQIATFAARYPRARIVVTSRHIGYRRTVLDNAGFAHHTIQDLNPQQIRDFVTRWYEIACPEDPTEAARRRHRLMTAVTESASIRELAGNPLLLTILAIIGRRQELPRDRRSVYEHAASVLVEHWDVERHLRVAKIEMEYIHRDDKFELLRRVARRMQESRAGLAGNHIQGSDLVAEFDAYLRERYPMAATQAAVVARAMLAQFRERNFILSHFGGEVYGFVHRAFLEYFSAADIVHRFRDEREWEPEPFVAAVFGRHWPDPAWQEVLLLVAGMIDERYTATAIDHLRLADPLWSLAPDEPPGHLLLAVRCMGEVRRLGLLRRQGRELLDDVIGLLEIAEELGSPRGRYDYFRSQRVIEWLTEVVLPVLAAVGANWPGRERYLDWYTAYRCRSDRFSSTADLTSRVLAMLFGDSAAVKASLRGQALLDDEVYRQGAARALATAGREDPELRSFLQDRATADLSDDVRRTCLEAIAETWPDDPDLPGWLRERASADPASNVRLAAVTAMSTSARDDPNHTIWLRRCVSTDPAGDVRKAAVRALGDLVRDRPALADLVRELATEDRDPDVRQAAVDILASLDGDPRDTAQWLRGIATTDRDHEVRATAIRRLPAPGQADEDHIAWLVACATGDPQLDVRRAAVEELATTGRGDRAMGDWLRERAETDPAEGIRRAALDGLVSGWRDDPDLPAWLRHSAATDPHPDVRKAAVDALATGWRDDPDLPAWLRHRATTDPYPDVRRAAVDALATGWRDDPELLPRLRELVTDPHPDVRKAAVDALTSGWRDDPELQPLLRGLATDADPLLRQTAIEALSGADGEPSFGDWVTTYAREDPHGAVRAAALRAVAAMRRGPDTAALLRDRGATEIDGWIRQSSVLALASAWPDDPELACWLRDRAVNDPDEAVRQTAVRGYARALHAEPGLRDWLRDRVSAEPDKEVRQAALQELVAGWRGDPELADWLRTHAVIDASGDVRLVALRAITTGGQGDAVSAALLRARATNDADSSARLAAVQALSLDQAGEPATHDWLLDRAVNDPYWRVRQTAVQLWSILAAAQPELPGWLRDRAENDRDEDVRETALRALVTGWRDDPDVRELVRNRAEHDRHPTVRRRAAEFLEFLEFLDSNAVPPTHEISFRPQ